MEAFDLRARDALGLVEELDDLGFVDRRLRRRNPLDAAGGVEGAPGLDKAPESVVGSEHQIGVVQWLLGDGASVVFA